MAVITQNYDIDLKATGEYPVVKMSQFDTGSRTIVFTVYDGRELAQIDGMVARVDGTRADDVEFSRTCTVGTGSKVSFTISQEMTKCAGKHAAELVIFDADGNPIGTQNFIIEVEAASMRRDSAASADDRTLYDQYTDSVSKRVDDKIASVSKAVADKTAQMDTKYADFTKSMSSKADTMNRTAGDIRGLTIGASSTEVLNVALDVSKLVSSLSGRLYCRVTYEPVTALVTCRVSCDSALTQKAGHGSYNLILGVIADKYLPKAELFDFTDSAGTHIYRFCNDSMNNADVSAGISLEAVGGHPAGAVSFSMAYYTTPQQDVGYHPDFTVSWYARGGKYLDVTPIDTGGNTVSIGTVTTGAPGTQASVVNSGTAKDVVLDFTIPKGDKGENVKVGAGLSVDPNGLVQVRTSGPVKAGTSNIPIGIGGGSGMLCMAIDATSFTKGTIDSSSSYMLMLKPASTSTVGGVKIGAGINVSADGTIDVQALLNRITALETKVAALEAK